MKKDIGLLHGVEVSVGLFPGQGAYLPGVLDQLSGPAVQAIDAVASGMLGRGLGMVTGPNRPDVETLLAQAPDVLQVAVFATSVAHFETLRDSGTPLSVLLGHSLGEIAALVCAGALDVTEGAEILCHRITVLREQDTSGGGLLALACERDRVEQIVALLPESGATVAVDNGAQTVVSGTADTLRRVDLIASAMGVPATALRSPHPFHNPALRQARQVLAKRIGGYRSRGLRTPVFSPILGRYYRDTDDLGELLASHLVLPVEFGPAVERLHRAGARIWVEIGAGRALTTLVRRAYPEAMTQAQLTGAIESTVEVVPPVSETAPAPVQQDDIAARIRAIYAAALEYPEDVFDDDAALEADLGVDSVKQTELLGRLGEIFQLGPRPEGMRMSDYRTFGSVVQFVQGSLR